MTRPRLHVVALSHLDTQWRWTVRDTVARFLPHTVEANEPLFDRFPDYTLSFEGSYRYRLLAEHDPVRFERVRERVAEGRWHPAGGGVEAFDTLLPAPEAIGRQLLYGRRWFRRELGRDSRDLFLPDCFGFPATLPTLAAHFGMLGFVTQKLRRGELMRSAFGIPFPFGRWRGPDGSELLAALDPGEYSGRISGDLTRDPIQLAAFAALPAGTPPVRLLFVGIGDRGGAVPEATIEALHRAIRGDGPIEVRHGPSERIFTEIDASERARLPTYDGELLLRVHATGCYTAKSLLKRWNRRIESLARVAETAATAALAAGRPVARKRLERAWERLLAHQMHDDLTGTSIPAAYAHTLADLGFAANEFGEIALDAASAAIEALETMPTPDASPALVAVTPLATAVDELVEVERLPEELVAVEAADGTIRAIQRLAGNGRALVPVAAPGAGLQRLRLSPRAAAAPAERVEVGERHLENARYRVRFGDDGALVEVHDKRLGRNLLAAPASLDLLPDHSAKYPAWEVLWSDLSAPVRERVDRSPRLELLERGPLRVALGVERRARGVVVRERWRLAAGASGERVEAEVEIVWRRRARLLKARFVLAAENDHAHYDTGLGAIARPIASERLYEVPAQHWAAIVDRDAGFGVALLADARHGWDQPDARTLRSTWIHAPRASFKWRHQATQDFGVHRFRFALAGLSADDVSAGGIATIADRFVHRPWVAWESGGAPTSRGTTRRTLVSLSNPLRLLALKPAEDDARAILRVSNPGVAVRRVEFAAPPGAFEPRTTCDGMEQPTPAAVPEAIAGRGLATFATAPFSGSADPRSATCIALDLGADERVASAQDEASEGAGFDGAERWLPLELLPTRLEETAVPFDLGGDAERRGAAVRAREQSFDLPPGSVEVWLLGAVAGGEREVAFEIDGAIVSRRIPDWRAPLLREPRRRALAPPAGPAEFDRRATAWSCEHLHDAAGRDLPMERATLFAIRLPGGSRLRFPDEPRLVVLAATASTAPTRTLDDAEPAALG